MCHMDLCLAFVIPCACLCLSPIHRLGGLICMALLCIVFGIVDGGGQHVVSVGIVRLACRT